MNAWDGGVFFSEIPTIMASSSPEFAPAKPTSYMGAWIASLVLIIAFVLGLLLYPPLDESPPVKGSDNILMVGRFHPIFVHLPAGVLAFLVLLELLCVRKATEERMGPAALLALWVGSAGAVMAVMAGIFLSREGGYGGGNFSLHQTMGIIGTAGVLFALVLRIIAMSQGNRGLLDVYRAVLFVSFGIMGAGAHFGANMVHGSKYLTQYAPPEVAAKVKGFEEWLLGFVEEPKEEEPATQDAPAPKPPGLPTQAPDKPKPPVVADTPVPADVDGKTVFQHVILPILEEKCNSCHNEDKAKGDLAMHTYEAAMTTGDSAGESFIPGKPDESLSLVRIGYPEDDDEHMPPEGKPQMTEPEIALLRWWIQEGASDKLAVADASFPPETQSTVDEILKASAQDHP